MEPVSHTAGSSNFNDSLSQKHSSVSDNVELTKNLNWSSETNVSSKPTSDNSLKLDPNYFVLSKLYRSGKITVKLPTVKQSLDKLVKNSRACTVTAPKRRETPFSAVFSNFAQQFSYDNLKNVTDLPKKGQH